MSIFTGKENMEVNLAQQHGLINAALIKVKRFKIQDELEELRIIPNLICIFAGKNYSSSNIHFSWAVLPD
jgi:hypothetical protein